MTRALLNAAILVLFLNAAYANAQSEKGGGAGPKIEKVGKKARTGTEKVVNTTTKALKHAGKKTAGALDKAGHKTGQALGKAAKKTKEWVQGK